MRKLTGFEIAQIARECDTDIETIRHIDASIQAQGENASASYLEFEAAFRGRIAEPSKSEGICIDLIPDADATRP